MRADPMDRIISDQRSAAASVSVPRIFAVGLVLPFAHPRRLLLCSLVPAGIVAWLVLGPYGQAMGAWRRAIMLSTVNSPGAPYPFVTTSAPTVFLSAEGLMLVALALWLCAWQRATVRDFREPILNWLGGSLLRLPGYTAALLIWMLAPTAIVSLVTGGVGWAIQRDLTANGARPFAGWWFNYINALSRTQWIEAGLGVLAAMLVALWLSARLSTLPPLVASQGWRKSFGRSWQISRGHGFGLSVSIVGYSILSFLAAILVGSALAVMAYRRSTDLGTDASTFSIAVIVDLCILVLVMLWQASLGALVVRDSRSPAEIVDPAMFD
jgi:hypothetical protein